MKTRFLITCMLSTALVAVTPLTLHADMVDTSRMLATEQGLFQGDRDAQSELVMSFMARDEVRNQLESLGVDPAMAAERVAGLTDSQLQQLAGKIQDMPAGSGALGIVLAVLVIILLLEILGITNISSKV
jgi:hypothetical protein